MKKLLLPILIICSAFATAAYFAVPGGSTVALPGGATSVTMQWRRSGTDSLRQHWANDGTGWNRYYSATEINSFGLLSTASTIAASQISPNTISSISLGGSLANLTATDATLTFSGSYNGSTARTVGLNLSNTNTWIGAQTFSGTVATSPIVLNSAASSSIGIFWRNNTISRWRTYINSGGSILFDSYADGSTAVTQGNWNMTSGILALTVQPTFPTATPNDNSTKGATTAYVDAAVLNIVRGRVVLSGNVTAILNYDYLNATSTQYTLTPPATTGFANDGSKIITGLATGSGGIRVSCPSGYVIQTPSGNVTPGTGFATIGQNQKFQLIPIGTNSYYLQPLNGSITVS